MSSSREGHLKVADSLRDAVRLARDSEERFRSFSENFPGLVWISDSRGRYRYVNRNLEQVFDRPAEQWIGKSPEELLSEDVARAFSRNDEQVLSTGAPIQATEKVKHSDTTWHFLVSKFPIRSADQTMIGGLAIDITSRVMAEEEARKMRDALLRQERIISIAQLSSGLAHDLNNTLNAISLRLSLIKDDPRTARSTNIEKIMQLVFDAAGSVRRLQEYVRAHRERLFEQLDLPALIRGAIDSVRPKLECGDSPVSVRLAIPELPPVFGSASDVHQVFTILLLNACDAMRDGGTVEIEAACDGTHITVTIADRGGGIPTQYLDKVFDPFFSTKQQGSGLGLAMAFSVMMRLGGNISVSNRVGGGAIFVLTFPVAENAPASRPAAQQDDDRSPIRSVLVIDDDLDNLDATRAVLALKGYRVSIASSGPEGLELMRAEPQFDSVICDIGMPDMNGWEVAERIAELSPRTRIFMLSGWANEISDTDPRRKLVVDVLAKPVDLDQIDRILGGVS